MSDKERCPVCRGEGEVETSVIRDPNRGSLAALGNALDEINRLTAEVSRLEGICNKAAGAIITKKYKAALAAVMSGVPDAASSQQEPK